MTYGECCRTLTPMVQARTRRQLVQLGAALRRARLDAGLTQYQLAQLAGISRQLVSRVEAGNPHGEVGGVVEVADALGLSLTVVPKEQRAAAPSGDRKAIQDLLSRIRDGHAPASFAPEEGDRD